jgi:hypothetical protein
LDGKVRNITMDGEIGRDRSDPRIGVIGLSLYRASNGKSFKFLDSSVLESLFNVIDFGSAYDTSVSE